MKNILFVAYEFPPLNRGGVFRSLAFVKYLPQYGYNPVVITLAEKSYALACGDNLQTDHTLGEETLKNTNIEEIESDLVPLSAKGKLAFFLGTWFTIHGREGDGWRKDFHRRIGDILAKYQPVCVFATIPPFGILPLISEFAEHYRLPLVLDFRDAWSQWRMNPYGTYLHYLLTLQYEKRYLKQAAAVIVTSMQTKSDFLSLHKGVETEKIHYIPNGFEGNCETWKPIDPEKPSYCIGYVGSFYYDPLARDQMLKPWWKKTGHRIFQFTPDKQDWLYRTPFFFFRAIRHLIDTDPETGKKISMRFAGKSPEWLKEMINFFKLEKHVTLLGVLPHKESLEFQKSCDLLLITSAKRIGGRDYSIAGKTFEYFKMQRPILAFVCEGSQKDILLESGTALVCDPDNPAESSAEIKRLLEGKTRLVPDTAFLAKLNREKLTGDLALVIDRVTGKRLTNTDVGANTW